MPRAPGTTGDRSVSVAFATSGAERSPAVISDAQRAIALAVVPMTAFAVVLALTSRHVRWPGVNALYYGYQTAAPLLIGLYWWVRRPASRFGLLLMAFGV